MKNKIILWISSSILLFALFSLWIRLPLISSQIRMSPDETANVVSAVSYARQGTFGLKSEYTERFFWLTPRSFVFVPEAKSITPIGFLGMPFILSIIYRLTDYFGLGFFVPIFAFCTIFALWQSLPKQWSGNIKLMTVVIWMSFPTVIIYANRGVFPQMMQLCLMVWVWYFVNHKYKKITYPLAGIFTGLALAIRPLEAIWIIPVIIFAFFHRYNYSIADTKLIPSKTRTLTPNKSTSANIQHSLSNIQRIGDAILFIVPLILLLLFFAKLGADTYGKWLVSGYQIRPEVGMEAISDVVNENQLSSYGRSVDLLESLPFGIHPRNIIWNIKNYFGIMLWPWMLVMLIVLYFLYKDKFWKTTNKWGVLALAWSFLTLIIFYGNGIYQDHIIINQVSIGNSFLRYTLPTSIVFSLALGYLFSKMIRLWTLKTLGYCLAICLILFGIWSAVSRDDEGIFANENELLTYQQIRLSAFKSIGQNVVIASDRSDKIFFPYWLSVSPMPNKTQITELLSAGAEVAIFQTTQDEKGIADWQSYNLNLIPSFTINNQTMYHVQINN